jgi:hypothetical protein
MAFYNCGVGCELVGTAAEIPAEILEPPCPVDVSEADQSALV